MRLVGGTIKRAGRIIVRKVTGRSRTAMRGEAALTVTHGCVGWGVEERGAKIRREGERDIRRDTERRVRVVREREIKGERDGGKGHGQKGRPKKPRQALYGISLACPGAPVRRSRRQKESESQRVSDLLWLGARPSVRERQRPRVRVGASETENVETLGVEGGRINHRS